MFCYQIDEHGRAHEVGLDEAFASVDAAGRSAWIDVESPTRDEAAALLARFRVDRELIEQFLETGHAARTLALNGGLFFELPFEITGQPAELKSAVFICLDRVLVTLRGEIRDAGSWVTPSEASSLDFGDGSAPILVSTLLIELSLRLRSQSLDGRRRLTELAERLDEDLESVSVEEIVSLKRRIFDLDAISEERSASLESLGPAERFFSSSPGAADRLGIAIVNTAATTRRLDRLDRRVEALQSRIDSFAQERINRRLSRLTIISAIFLPLTLIAGIYGMNFEIMPELGYRYAYPLTLAGMVIITLGLLWWFRRGGWMD
jgi:Mg2+ and Co2+ transporter CorA